MRSPRPWLGALVAVAALLFAGWMPAPSGVAQPEAASPTQAADPLPDITKPDLSKAELCPVVSVADGDTFTIERGGRSETVRLIGVDTPETKDPRKEVQFYGKEASEFLSNLLRGEEVYVIAEGRPDKYGRTLAQVYRAPDGLWVNLELVRQGYAQVYSGDAFEDISLFLAYQRRAREVGKGLWDDNRKAEWKTTPATGTPAAVPASPVTTRPAEKPAPEVKPVPQKVTVYVTRTGSKYHRASCSYLRSSSIPMDLEDAKARYGPCSRCSPPR